MLRFMLPRLVVPIPLAFACATAAAQVPYRSPAADPSPAAFALPPFEQRLQTVCEAAKPVLIRDVSAMLSAGRPDEGLTRLKPCVEALDDRDLDELQRRLQVASLRAALRKEPPGNVKRREQLIRELALVDPHWRRWHGKEMATIEAREREAQKRREARDAREARAKASDDPAKDSAVRPAAGPQRNQETLAEYAMLLGRSLACGIDTRHQSKLVASWIDSAFPIVARAHHLETFAASMEHHAQQQALGRTATSCESVQRTVDKMSDADWSGSR